jgi:hypothetical protein
MSGSVSLAVAPDAKIAVVASGKPALAALTAIWNRLDPDNMLAPAGSVVNDAVVWASTAPENAQMPLARTSMDRVTVRMRRSDSRDAILMLGKVFKVFPPSNKCARYPARLLYART